MYIQSYKMICKIMRTNKELHLMLNILIWRYIVLHVVLHIWIKLYQILIDLLPREPKSNSRAPNHYIPDLKGLPNPSFVNPLFIPSSFMERTVSETYRPWLLVLKPSKQQSSIISSLLRVEHLAPASFKILEASSTSPCLMTVTNFSLPDLFVVVISTNLLLACGNLTNCLRDLMDSSDYPCSLCVASLDAFNLIVVISKLVELLSFVFH